MGHPSQVVRVGLLLALIVQPAIESEIAAKTTSDFVTSTEFNTMRSVCKPLPSTMTLCQGIGYTEMRLPNLLGHDSAREAQQHAGAWVPLVAKQCHRDTQKFLCSLFAPVCLQELTVAVRPCRSLCEDVRDGCLPVMSAFGFPWPDMFNCSRFPRGGDLCIPGVGHAGRIDTTESKGVVICEVCGWGVEGERAIQQDFCKSQFAFRLRLAAATLEGPDLRLLPQGRSRVLRWAGTEEDLGAATEQSALWLPEASGCSCQALQGQLEGSFLALADMQAGRMVLSQLVKWSHSEKELKRFIRRLLKTPCSGPDP